MADKKERQKPGAVTPFTAETSGGLSASCFKGVIELDSVDWGAVARCYKLLRMRSDSRRRIAQNEKLAADFERWITMRSQTAEFDIALRMLFDEAMESQRLMGVVEGMKIKNTTIDIT